MDRRDWRSLIQLLTHLIHVEGARIEAQDWQACSEVIFRLFDEAMASGEMTRTEVLERWAWLSCAALEWTGPSPDVKLLDATEAVGAILEELPEDVESLVDLARSWRSLERGTIANLRRTKNLLGAGLELAQRAQDVRLERWRPAYLVLP